MTYRPPYVCKCGAKISRETMDGRISNFRWRVFRHEQTKRHLAAMRKLAPAVAGPSAAAALRGALDSPAARSAPVLNKDGTNGR